MKKKKINPNKPFIAIISAGSLEKHLKESNAKLKRLLKRLST